MQPHKPPPEVKRTMEKHEEVAIAATREGIQAAQRASKEAIERGGYAVQRTFDQGQELLSHVFHHPVRHAQAVSHRASHRAERQFRNLTEIASDKAMRATSATTALVSYFAKRVNYTGHRIIEPLGRIYNYAVSVGVLKPLGITYPLPVHKPGRGVQPVVLITGCGSGIGRQTALDFASAGYIVYAGVRDEIESKELVTEFQRRRRGGQGTLSPIKLDITNEDDRHNVFQDIKDYLKRQIDQGQNAVFAALINNAAEIQLLPWEATSEQRLKQFIDTNALSHILLTHQFMPLLRNDNGRVINMSSMAAFAHVRTLGPLSTAKAAMSVFGETLRLEMRDFDVGVIDVKPGFIETRATGKMDEQLEDLIRKLLQGEEPFRSELPHNVRKQYALQLYDFSKLTYLMQGIRIPSDAVSKTIRHALCSAYPKDTYYVGLDARLAAVADYVFGRKLWLVVDWVLAGFR